MTAAATPPPPNSPTERLRRMALWMRVLIALGAAILLAVPGYFWVAEPSALQRVLVDLVPATASTAPTTQTTQALPAAPFTITPHVKGWAIVAVAFSVALGLYALLQLWHLFGAYGRGVVFGPEASGRLRKLAWALMAAALVRPLTKTVIVLLLTWHNPPGQRQLVLGLSWDDYLSLLFGGLLFAMSWAMAEARRLEQENAGFV